MENTFTPRTPITREEAWRRLRESKRRKQEWVDSISDELKADYKARTGKDATEIEVW
ncbi:MAG: protein tyrosine phosphatase [Bacteroidales bacterium]|nr:protein tyrosine phosphatase [Bacteroidales bacterium]